MRITDTHIIDYQKIECKWNTELSSEQNRYNYNRFQKERQKAPRVYVEIKDETILENVGNRVGRPYQLWRPLVAEKLRELGIEFTRIRWSQYAGCSCPCSPGFIVEGAMPGKSIWMAIEGSPKTTKPEEAAYRQAQLLRDPTINSALLKGETE